MSGECTVTPGTTWSSDPISDLKLNQTANPTVRLNESAVGLRELDVQGVSAAIIGGTMLDNWFYNPLFVQDQQPAGVGGFTANRRLNTAAAQWYYISSAGDAQTTAVQSGSPGKMLSCQLSNGISNFTLGQCFFQADAQPLRGKTVTISLEILNQSGQSITPRLRLRTFSGPDNAATGTQVYNGVATGVTTSIANNTITRLAWTVEFNSGLGINVENGFDVQFFVDMTLNATAPLLGFRAAQLVIAGADVPFSAAVPRRLFKQGYRNDATPSATLNDIDGGWMVGDECVCATALVQPTIWRCLSNAPDAAVWRPITNIVRVVNRWSTVTTTPASITTVIPLDNTIPQITEGAEVFALPIQPFSTANRLRMRFSGFVEQSAAGYITAALFRDAVANAVYATTRGQGTASNGGRGFEWTFDMAVPDTAAQTWRVRIGPNTGTAAWLQTNSTALFGGVMQGLFEIEEITNT